MSLNINSSIGQMVLTNCMSSWLSLIFCNKWDNLENTYQPHPNESLELMSAYKIVMSMDNYSFLNWQGSYIYSDLYMANVEISVQSYYLRAIMILVFFATEHNYLFFLQ